MASALEILQTWVTSSTWAWPRSGCPHRGRPPVRYLSPRGLAPWTQKTSPTRMKASSYCRELIHLWMALAAIRITSNFSSASTPFSHFYWEKSCRWWWLVPPRSPGLPPTWQIGYSLSVLVLLVWCGSGRRGSTAGVCAVSTCVHPGHLRRSVQLSAPHANRCSVCLLLSTCTFFNLHFSCTFCCRTSILLL